MHMCCKLSRNLYDRTESQQMLFKNPLFIQFTQQQKPKKKQNQINGHNKNRHSIVSIWHLC